MTFIKTLAINLFKAVALCLLIAAFVVGLPKGTAVAERHITPLEQVLAGLTTPPPTDGDSGNASITSNGQYVAYESNARNITLSDNYFGTDVFLYNTRNSETYCISCWIPAGMAPPTGPSSNISASSNGRYVTFQSDASNFVRNDVNDTTDIFLYDMQTHRTTLVSKGVRGPYSNGASTIPTIDGSGRHITFQSEATNLTHESDYNAASDIFVYDIRSRQTRRVTNRINRGSTDGPSVNATISNSGRYISYQSAASDLISRDNNGTSDIFVYDTRNRTTERISINPTGGDTNGPSINSSISNNGNSVSFQSAANNIVANDANGLLDVFLYDRLSGTTQRISVSVRGGDPNGQSAMSLISSNSRYVAFESTGTNLVTDDHNGVSDIFLYDTANRVTTRVTSGVAGGNTNGPSGLGQKNSLSSDGRYTVYSSSAYDIVLGDSNSRSDVFLYDRVTNRSTLISNGY